MKKLKIEIVENTVLLALALLFFFAINSALPKYVSIIGALIVSLYFFPIKLIKNLKKIKTNGLISDVVISISMMILIIGLYIENKMIVSIFTGLNLIFLVFFTIQENKTNELSKIEYRKIIISHLILVFLLQLVRYS